MESDNFYECNDTCASCAEYCCSKRYWSYLSKETHECESCYEQSKLDSEQQINKGVV